MFDGEIEVDESYFGGWRKGKHGRGAAGKVPVFGLLKRGGKGAEKGARIDPPGYDAGKRIKGKKRHLLVNTLSVPAITMTLAFSFISLSGLRPSSPLGASSQHRRAEAGVGPVGHDQG